MRSTRAKCMGLACGALLLAAAAAADEGYRLSQTCAGCHGTDGASPGAAIPIIGGHDAAYLARSMREYRDGGRGFYVMKIVAAGFGDAGIDAIAEWFAGRPWRATPVANDPALAAAGEAVAARRCAGCHGADGRGGALGPRLAGQPADYLIRATRAYRTGERRHGTAAAGHGGISDGDLAAVAHYYAGLR